MTTVVGLTPWLPWPLSRWRSWTEPVRAERLAALRIGLGVVLLLDVLIGHLPQVHEFWGPGSLAKVGDRDLFAATFRGRWLWSSLRGLTDPFIFATTVVVFAILTGRIFVSGLRGTRGTAASRWTPRPGLIAWWGVSASLALLAVWSWLNKLPQASDLSLRGRGSLLSAGVVWIFAGAMFLLVRRETARQRWVCLGVWGGATAFLLAGILRAHADHGDRGPLPFDWLLTPWNDSRHLVVVAMLLWAVCAFLLTLGLWTRVAAVTAWLLANSFDNLNPHMTNHGDTVRTTILFYLMLSPCAATWSLDSVRGRPRGDSNGPVWVHPWPLRLLMMQLMMIYCFNGLYKALGSTWRYGNSLYYVMADLFNTRMSYAQFPIPPAMLRPINYVVLIWETFFPVLVFVPRLRVVILMIGVLFHIGIGLGLELGPFQAYMLCLYLPFVPWEKWVRGGAMGDAVHRESQRV